MSYNLGKDCIAYYNTATYGSPTWAAITSFKEVTINGENRQAELTSRASRFVGYKNTLCDVSVEGTLLYNDNEAAGQEAIRGAFWNGTVIDMAFASAAIASSGTEYVRSEFEVSKWTRTEPLEEGCELQIELKPSKSTNGTIGLTETA